MADKPNATFQPKGSGASSADGRATRQWDGHVRHLKHLAEQEQDRRARRDERLRKRRVQWRVQ